MCSKSDLTINNMARAILERARSGLPTTQADLLRSFPLIEIQTFGQRAVAKASSMAAAEGIEETFLEVNGNAYVA